MGIDVALVDEKHEPSQEVFDPNQYLTTLSIGEWARLRESICLRFIDAWGTTTFNQAQLPCLIAELEHSASGQSDRLVQAHLEKVLRLVHSARGKAHMYVKFVGD